MSSKQFTIKTNAESIEIFEEAYNAERQKTPELTKGQFFEKFVLSKKSVTPADVDLSNFVTADAYDEVVNNNNENAFLINDICRILNISDKESIIEEIRDTQHRAMAVPTEKIRDLQENEILIQFPEIHQRVMNEVCRRLTKLNEQSVTPQMILLDMFIRYELQRNEEWFYPHLIKENEFLAITGKTYNELKKWLNNL